MKTDAVSQCFECLKDLQLAAGDFAIFGSAPLFVRGIIQHMCDIDIICRGAAWEKVRKIGSLQFSDDYDVAIVTINDGKMTFGNKWGIGNFDVNILIDEAEIIDGLPFVQLQHVVEYKLARRSDKDLLHIELLRKSKYSSLVGDLN